MDEGDHQTPGLASLLGRLGRTSLGLVRNRAELLSVEWQEEKIRLAQLLISSLALVLLSMLAVLLICALVIMLVPEEYRIWAVAGFAVLFGSAATWAWFRLKALMDREPFAESLEQVRKDAEWLETSK